MSTKPTRLMKREKGERERFQVTVNCCKNSQRIILFHQRITESMTFGSAVCQAEVTENLWIVCHRSMWKSCGSKKSRPVLGMIEYDNRSIGTDNSHSLFLHPSTTKTLNLWMWNYCFCESFHCILTTVPDFPGWGEPTHTPLSSEYWGYYLLHLQSRGVERAIKVSHCPEIIIRWCLRPRLEIMGALVGP